MRMHPALAFKVAALILLLAALVVPLTSASAEPPAVVIQFLNVSDWHAQIDPLIVSNVNYGGAAVLSTYWKADRAQYPNTITFTAGDAYGASPPLSNFFNEEPAVLTMRMMGINIDTFGNHNFDRGVSHLQSMISLAKSPAGTNPGEPFSYVVGNLKARKLNLKRIQPYHIFDMSGVKVAMIGLVNPEAPTLVFPGNFGTMTPSNPVNRAMRLRERARQEGAEVFVIITHMGVTGFDNNNQPFGPLVDFANKVSGFDVIFGDHTDIQYSGTINDQLVIENRSKGFTYARTLLKVRPQTGKVVEKSSEFVSPLSANVTPDAAIETMLQPYRDALAPIFNTSIGTASMTILRSDKCGQSAGRTCESAIGNLVTDAMRTTYGTDFAITNSGGIRDALTCPTVDVPTDFCPSFVPPPFPITRGQAQAVLPFGNVVVTLQVNGAELKSMLENGVSAMPGVNGKFPQVSGLCFTYDIHAAAGSRVTGAVRQANDGSCTGAAVDLTAGSNYTIAENDFMASGGDTYPNFFSRAVTRDVMVNVVADYIGDNSPLSPVIQNRIVCTTSGATTCPTILP